MAANQKADRFETHECQRCWMKIRVPRLRRIEDQKELAAAWRSGRRIEAIVGVREKDYFGDLANGKTLMTHISNPKDCCLHCGARLPESSVTFCPSCNGLNLN